MELSYKILTVKGIAIELHVLFIIFILAFLIINPLFSLLLGLIFFYVTLHELAHSLVALRHKIIVRRIILLPIGGVSMINAPDIKPATEIKIALAGPLLNIFFVYVCMAIAWIFNLPLLDWLYAFFNPDANLVLPLPELILFYSFYANLVLGYFNLFLPAFPLDGGRILRAVFALKMDYIKATQTARFISMAIAVGLFFLGFFARDIWLMIIAFFIGFGANAEYQATVAHRAFKNIRLRDVLSQDYVLLEENEKIQEAVDKLFQRRKLSALVTTKRGLKLIDLPLISRVPKTKWPTTTVSTVARTAPKTLAHASVEFAVKKMNSLGTDMLAVYDGKKFAGVIYRSDVEKTAKLAQLTNK